MSDETLANLPCHCSSVGTAVETSKNRKRTEMGGKKHTCIPNGPYGVALNLLTISAGMTVVFTAFPGHATGSKAPQMRPYA
jgi:hypothetical protein